MESKKIDELINAFEKSAEILKKIKVLSEKEEQTEDKIEKEKINKEGDDLLDLFMVQMLKLKKNLD